MKDIITSGLLAIFVLLLMIFTAPILNETNEIEGNRELEEVVFTNNPENEIKIDSNIHTPL